MNASFWHVPVLVYHHVLPSVAHYTNTPPDEFRRHMDVLSRTFTFWNVRQAYDAFERGDNSADHVVITFDDGYVDNHEHALPVLRSYGIAATFFVPTGLVGGDNSWSPRPSFRAMHMSWRQLQDLIDSGHDVGSHGVSHQPLVDLDQEAMTDEIVKSRLCLARGLGQTPQWRPSSLAYPFGLTNPTVSAAVAREYDVAFSTTKTVHINWSTHRHTLRRVYIRVGAPEERILAVVRGVIDP